MVDKLNLDANNITPQSTPADLELLRIDADITRIFGQYKQKTYNTFEVLQLTPATVTMALLWPRIEENSNFIFEILQGTHTSFDMPLSAGLSRQSGRLYVMASSESINKISAYFQNENGLWTRHYNKLTSPVDTGWRQIFCQNNQTVLTTGNATSLSGLLSNLLTPGEYYINGSLISSFTDRPYTAPCVITVSQLSAGDRYQSVRTNNSAQQESYRVVNSSGSAQPWRGVFVADADFTTSGQIRSSHHSPIASSSANLGGSATADRWGTLYTANNPNVSSDATLKFDAQEIKQELIKFVSSTPLKQYRLKADGSVHFGILITDAEYRMAHSLGATSLIVKGEDGIYSVCYAEWQNILLEGMRRKVSGF